MLGVGRVAAVKVAHVRLEGVRAAELVPFRLGGLRRGEGQTQPPPRSTRQASECPSNDYSPVYGNFRRREGRAARRGAAMLGVCVSHRGDEGRGEEQGGGGGTEHGGGARGGVEWRCTCSLRSPERRYLLSRKGLRRWISSGCAPLPRSRPHSRRNHARVPQLCRAARFTTRL